MGWQQTWQKRHSRAALVAYGLVALVMTWPLAARLGTHIPADQGSDFWVHEWTFWWLEQALLTLQNPYFTPYLYHPTGVSLTSHNIAWLNFGVWFPLQAAWGPSTAYAVAFLLLFPFNGYAMYLFAYDRVRTAPAAFIAGLVFAFWPYALTQYGHPNLLTLGWLPLAALYWTRSARGGTTRDAAMLGLFLALLGISRWQLLVPAAYVLALLVPFEVVRQPTLRAAIRLSALGVLAGVVALMLMAPLLAPVVVDQVSRAHATDLLVYEPVFSTDLASYVVPGLNMRHWQWLTDQLPAALHFAQEEITFLGYGTLLLGVLGLLVYPRRALLWLVMASVLAMLAAGPVLTVAGRELTSVSTPYVLIEDWLVNRLMRKPARFNIMLGLPLGMLAGLGVAALTRGIDRWSGKRGMAAAPAVVTALLAVLILVEYAVHPYPLAATAVPAWYRQLADEPGSFAVAAFPIGSRLADKFYMHDQTVHGRPILGGHVSRPPRESIAFMDASPMLDDMLFRRELDPARVDVSHQLRYLDVAGFRYLVLDKRQATDEQITAWRDWLTIAPRHEDDDVVVYTTAPEAGVDYTVAMWLTDAVGVIRAQTATTATEQGGLVTVAVRWAGASAHAPRYDACLRLRDATGAVRQTDCYALSPDWTTDRWAPHEVARGDYVLRVEPHLAPGDYAVELTLQDVATEEHVVPSFNLATLAVDALPRSFAPPQPQHTLDVRLGDVVTLRGYDLQVDDRVRLTLYWQARARMERPYKVFIHVVDATSGTLVVQHDAAPRNWQYPTTWWEAGEVVAEQIELPLPDDVAAADLAILVGLYDEETGVRLAPHGQPARISGDDAVILVPIQ